ncbi:hypothetical protein D9M68_670990 [compost metagenome]
MHKFDPRGVGEGLARHMRLAADAGGREAEFPRPGLGVFDQLPRVLDGKAGVDRDNHRPVRHLADEAEVVQRVRQLAVDELVDGEHAARREQQRVAVRRRLGDGLCAHAAAGACAVLDNHALLQALAQL